MRLKKLLKKGFTLVFMVAFVSSMFSVLNVPSARAFETIADMQQEDREYREQLAYYWAPVWYQDTNEVFPRGDYITKFDYDGNWNGNDNWDNIHDFPLNAYIYYSFVETHTQWFIGYYDFHPRDWSASEIGEHENDLEGALLVIAKTSTWGELLCMETLAHDNFYQYEGPSGVVKGTDNADIEHGVWFTNFGDHSHPELYVESGGHGVFGGGEVDGSYMVYYPRGIAEVPDNLNDRDVSYALISMDELWNRRFDTGGSGHTFDHFGVFDGDTSNGATQSDSAKAPWGWDDGPKWYNPTDNDGPTFTGEIFYNPADMIDVHFDGLGDEQEFSHHYSYNPYVIEVTIDWYGVAVDRDGQTTGDDNSDAYLKLYMHDGAGEYDWYGGLLPTPWRWDGVLDRDSGSQNSWVGENIPEGTAIDMHKELVERNLWERSEKSNFRPPRYWFYGIYYPDKPLFGIESRDADPGFDQWLMGTVDEDNNFHEVPGTRWYGLEKAEGQQFYDWGGSMAYITVSGESIDEDTSPPHFWNPNANPKGYIPLSYTGGITFSINVDDDNGIAMALFGYRGTETDWTWKGAHLTTGEEYPVPGWGTLVYTLDKSTWEKYNGQRIYHKWYAMDNDDDGGWERIDNMDRFSDEYPGPRIESAPPVGESPVIDSARFIAFQTRERDAQEDLNGDEDTFDSVIRYIDLWDGSTVNTRLEGWRPVIGSGIIAFTTDEHRIINYENPRGTDLNGDGDLDDSLLRYYDLYTGEVTDTGVWNVSAGSISGKIIALSTRADGWIMLYDITNQQLTNTTLKGYAPQLDGNMMAFLGEEIPSMTYPEPWSIRYYNITLPPETAVTISYYWGEPMPTYSAPSVSGNKIAFQTRGWIMYEDVSPGGYMVNTTYRGGSPVISGDLIAFVGAKYSDDPGMPWVPVIMYYDIPSGSLMETEEIGDSASLNAWTIAFETSEQMVGKDLSLDGDQDDNVIKYISTSTASTPTPPFITVGGLRRRVHLGFTLIKSSGTASIITHSSQEVPLPMKGLAFRSDALEITTTTQFEGPIQLGIPYDPTKITNEENLKLMVLDTTTMRWTEITTQIDTESKTIRGEISGLPSTVVILESTGPIILPTQTSELITASLGGQASNLIKTATINIPSGALSKDGIVAIDTPPIPEEEAGFLYENWQNIASSSLFKIDSISLENPATPSHLTKFATVSLKYDETKVDENKPQQLQVYHSTDNIDWQKLQILNINTELNTIKFLTNKFGEFVIIRDTEAATTSVTMPPWPGYIDTAGNIFVAPETPFRLTATDTLSGPMYSYYRINNGPWTHYKSPFNLTGPDGLYTIDYYTIDFAGNHETFKSITIFLDNYLVGALGETNNLKEDIMSLYENGAIDQYKHDRLIADLSSTETKITEAIHNFDTVRLGFDDKTEGFYALKAAVGKLEYLIYDTRNWVSWGRMTSDLANQVIQQLEELNMAMTERAMSEANLEKALTVAAIEDAQARGRNVAWLWNEISYINQYLAAADSCLAKSWLSKAVDYYKTAFYYSQRTTNNAYHWSYNILREDWIDQLEQTL